jgi:hypothetical protein
MIYRLLNFDYVEKSIHRKTIKYIYGHEFKAAYFLYQQSRDVFP